MLVENYGNFLSLEVLKMNQDDQMKEMENN